MAAERLGVPLERCTVELGDSELPPAPVAGGSNTDGERLLGGRRRPAMPIRDKLARPRPANDGRWRPTIGTALADGGLSRRRRSESARDSFKRVGAGAIEEYAENIPHGVSPTRSRRSTQGVPTLVGGAQGQEADVCASAPNSSRCACTR